MQWSKTVRLFLLAAASLTVASLPAFAAPLLAADEKAADKHGAANVKPDNTKVNKQDREQGEPTADDQKMNPADRELTRKIRRAVVADKSLSTYAHNVKIIAQDSVVTLKGPVRSGEEKSAIEAKAAEIAGSGNVKNNLTVAAKTTTK